MLSSNFSAVASSLLFQQKQTNKFFLGPDPKNSDWILHYTVRCTSCKNDDLGDSHVADSDGDDCDEGDYDDQDQGVAQDGDAWHSTQLLEQA